MKKTIIKLVTMMLVGISTVVSFAQSNNKLIKFANGKKSTVEKFLIPANDGITYYMANLKANTSIKFFVGAMYSDGTEGQGIEIKLTKSGSEKVLKEVMPGEEVTYKVKSAGDYIITVMNNPSKKKAKITLNLSIN